MITTAAIAIHHDLILFVHCLNDKVGGLSVDKVVIIIIINTLLHQMSNAYDLQFNNSPGKQHKKLQ